MDEGFCENGLRAGLASRPSSSVPPPCLVLARPSSPQRPLANTEKRGTLPSSPLVNVFSISYCCARRTVLDWAVSVLPASVAGAMRFTTLMPSVSS